MSKIASYIVATVVIAFAIASSSATICGCHPSAGSTTAKVESTASAAGSAWLACAEGQALGQLLPSGATLLGDVISKINGGDPNISADLDADGKLVTNDAVNCAITVAESEILGLGAPAPAAGSGSAAPAIAAARAPNPTLAAAQQWRAAHTKH